MVEATERLVNAYRELGGLSKEGLANSSTVDGVGDEGKKEEEKPADKIPVAKDWKFKSRSALRSVMGKGQEYWENSEGMERLKSLLEGLKN